MKTLKIGDKEYVLEFSFEAASHKGCINKMFKMMSGSYLGRSGVSGAADETKPKEHQRSLMALLICIPRCQTPFLQRSMPVCWKTTLS